MLDTREFKIMVEKCPLCGGKWRHYEGLLGYESLVCEVCRFDIAEIKVTAEPKEALR